MTSPPPEAASVSDSTSASGGNNCKEFLSLKENSTNVLLAKAVGSKAEPDLNGEPWCRYLMNKDIRLLKGIHMEEAKRCYKLFSLKTKYPNSHATTKQLLEANRYDLESSF